MTRIKELHIFLTLLSTGLSVAAASVVDTCGKEGTCENDRGLFCCGSCEIHFCCNGTSTMLDVRNCPEDEQEKKIGPSAQMLGAIIGGMAASFVCAISSQKLIKRLRKWRKSRTAMDPEYAADDPTTTSPPPAYEDAHMYHKLEKDAHGNKPTYHMVPTSMGVFSVLEAQFDSHGENFASGFPPSYLSVFPEESSKPHSCIPTISETISISEEDPDSVRVSVETSSTEEPRETTQRDNSRRKKSLPFLYRIFAGQGCL